MVLLRMDLIGHRNGKLVVRLKSSARIFTGTEIQQIPIASNRLIADRDVSNHVAITRRNATRVTNPKMRSEISGGKDFSRLSGRSEWYNDYSTLSDRISNWQKMKVGAYIPTAPNLFSVEQHQLVETALILRFSEWDKPEASVIIPVRDNIKLTIECLHSLLANTHGISYEIIVVDDGSADTTEVVLANVDNITYIKNDRSLGFVLSCNLAAESARGRFLVFLNNDVQVMHNWLKPLTETFFKHTNVGAVGPKVLFPDGRLQHSGEIVKMDGSTRRIGEDDDPGRLRYNYLREVDYLCGVCLMVETDTFRKMSGFDTRFVPGYFEDVDLCFALRRQGKRIIYNPESVIVHHLGSTRKSLALSRQEEFISKNQQAFVEKWQKTIEDLNQIRLISFYHREDPGFNGRHDQNLLAEQHRLTRKYGIHGWCFLYGWHNRKPLFPLPLDPLSQTGSSRVPFCLCWAKDYRSENKDGDSMVHKNSEANDWLAVTVLIRYMRLKEYIRINGRPLLLISGTEFLADIKESMATLRMICQADGIGDIYLALIEGDSGNRAVGQYGFDAGVEYLPASQGLVSDYREGVLSSLQQEIPAYARFRTVIPYSSDPAHSPQAMDGASPGTYQAWLERVLVETREQFSGEEQIVFLGAWNNCAADILLKPGERFGLGFLDATRWALDDWLLYPR